MDCPGRRKTVLGDSLPDSCAHLGFGVGVYGLKSRLNSDAQTLGVDALPE